MGHRGPTRQCGSHRGRCGTVETENKCQECDGDGQDLRRTMTWREASDRRLGICAFLISRRVAHITTTGDPAGTWRSWARPLRCNRIQPWLMRAPVEPIS
jgi:hypothetical protein